MPSLLGHGELRNSERELQQFQFRLGVEGAAMLAAFAILLGRFVLVLTDETVKPPRPEEAQAGKEKSRRGRARDKDGSVR